MRTDPIKIKAEKCRCKKLRDERRARGECAMCGEPSKFYRCKKCRGRHCSETKARHDKNRDEYRASQRQRYRYMRDVLAKCDCGRDLPCGYCAAEQKRIRHPNTTRSCTRCGQVGHYRNYTNCPKRFAIETNDYATSRPGEFTYEEI